LAVILLGQKSPVLPVPGSLQKEEEAGTIFLLVFFKATS